MAILSKKESSVMWAVYELAKDKPSALMTLQEIMRRVKMVRRFATNQNQVEAIMAMQAKTAAEQAGANDCAEKAIDDEMPIIDEDGNPYVEKKGKKKKKGQTIDEVDDEPIVHERVYIDEPSQFRGMFEYYKPVKYAEIPHILEVLEMEDFIELTEASADDGETQYVAALSSRGRRWERDERDRKRSNIINMAMRFVTPVISFALGLMLKFITP